MEWIKDYKDLLDEENTIEKIALSNKAIISSEYSSKPTILTEVEKTSIMYTAISFETLGYGLYPNDEGKIYFSHAFECRLPILEFSHLEDIVITAVDGLLADRVPEVRLFLDKIPFNRSKVDDWTIILKETILHAFLKLIRKRNGWEDVQSVLEEIQLLKKHQNEIEKNFLKNLDNSVSTGIGIELLGYYNLAKLIEIVGEYLFNGYPNDPIQQIRRHQSNILKCFKKIDHKLSHMVQLITLSCEQLIRNSIWSITTGLGEDIESFAKHLVNGTDKPILELWPSQRKALEKNLLDPYNLGIVVQMPTSAGKSLLAQFAIVQARAVYSKSTVAYIVPTRSLVNQVTLDLRKAFADLNLKIEAAVPLFELDPLEDQFLNENIDILVTTPEKLDLLIKANHKSVAELSLVVVDEAHNLGERTRGATLEFLLATLRQSNQRLKFLCLSPFLPNGQKIAEWLGGNRRGIEISVEWQASRTLIATFDLQGRASKRAYKLCFMPEQLQPVTGIEDLPTTYFNKEFSVPVASRDQGNRSKKNLVKKATEHLSNHGSVLVLCEGRGSAEKKAKEFIELFQLIEINDDMKLLIRLVEIEFGKEYFLVECLKRGIAYHHGGLPDEIRFLIERMIRENQIKVVCATTTLAQGVNFPISTIVFDTLKFRQRGMQSVPFPHHLFWNIAGRAGRAMQDSMGLIVYPTGTLERYNFFKKYIKEGIESLVSSLLEILQNLNEISMENGSEVIRNYPAFSAFVRYITHIIRVGKYEDLEKELDSIMRTTLVYHTTYQENPELAEHLIDLFRMYLGYLQGRGKINDKSYLSLIDHTGFSSYGVDILLHPENKFDRSDWDMRKILNSQDDVLTRMVETIAKIPEIKLGIYNQHGQFGAENVANVIRDWMVGKSIKEIASKSFQLYGDQKIQQCGSYIMTKVKSLIPWGLGAIQTISLGEKTDDWQLLGHIPALVHYGVNSKNAALLCMVGLPRFMAHNMEEVLNEWDLSGLGLTDIRTRLEEMDVKKWAKAGEQMGLTGNESKRLWLILNGKI